uniref:NAC domain-containing protein 74-like n=2 Tax=Nicotiana TaxID=4085 RepID=A0A1S3YAC3_TOBAC|nr:NAC transcription factor 32-like [Nicotiana tomentosiformis]XP_016449206.1 PREDICTED: NAC domain-containing protein 74-like [Nicotiana tabacum]
MCPLAPAAPPPGLIGSCWSDDQIILSLDQINCGSLIPDDVIVDNPYQYDPSNLPDGAWFLVSSNEKKETKHGFWKAKGESCEIFANSAIYGWRTTFEFVEAQVPIGQKTVWMMQEYKITQKEQHDHIKSKESALCRVFSCSDENINNERKPENINKVNNETKPEHRNDDLDTLLLSLMPSITPHTSSNDGQRSIGEPQVKNQTEGIGPDLFDDDIVAELDCIFREDYLELNDLVGVASHSSSSENSSRQSLASDEYFDSMAFLRDLDDEKNQDLHGKGSTSNYRIMMYRRENDVVMQPTPLESLISGSAAVAKDTQPGPSNKAKFPSKSSPEQDVKRLKAECTNDEGPSHSYRATASSSSSSSSSHEPVATREEKRKKKLKKFLCFMPF